MRPDYTLSIWPVGFTAEEAEKQEIIVHIHFDAKYRVSSIREIMGGDDINPDEEKEEELRGTYKRADLLKMHAYKDAIRRTGGAYVLYPGSDRTDPMKGFHEIIPGLGAFSIRPSATDDGTLQLKEFIQMVIAHLMDRASQYDRMSYHKYKIHESENTSALRESLPEKRDEARAAPPADTSVLIGSCENDELYGIIESDGLFCCRMNASDRFTSGMANPDYLVLYSKDGHVTSNIMRISENGP
ncbi:nuclease domain-containing protein, partial [Bacteroidota bacterium]